MAGPGRFIAIGVVALAALGGGYFALPSKATKTEHFTVEHPAEVVFARLANQPPGKALAQGVTQQDVVSAENNQVIANVAYAAGGAGRVIYKVTPKGANADVDMSLEQPVSASPVDRVQALFGGQVAPLATAAATTVGNDLKALPNATFVGLQYSVVQVAAKPFFYVENCSSSDPDSITSIIAQAVASLPPVMRLNNLQPAGPLMAVEPRVVPGQYCYQVGYPYTGRTPRALLIGKTGQTPSGTLLHVTYTGTEADVVPQVYDKLDALLAAANIDDPSTPSDDWPTFEVYNDDPMQAGGSRNRDIYYVTKGDISRLNTILPPSATAPVPPPADAAAATTSTATTTATTTSTATTAPATP